MRNKSQKPTGPGCDVFDPGSLPLELAMQRILATIKPVSKTTLKPIRKSVNRVLAQDIHAPFDVPNHTNSAMDGFALATSSLDEQGLGTLKLIGEAYAGKPYTGAIKRGQTVRITTGAVMPEGADSVAMKEYADVNDTQITLTKAVKNGQNVRQAGEDIPKGHKVLSKGRRLQVVDLGLLASLGVAQVAVFKKPKVAFFSNGDELKQVGETLGLGELHDSNRYTLYGMLKNAGAKGIDLGVVGDQYEAIRETMLHADSRAQMVVTSAGASVGEADFIYDILHEIGQVDFWKLAIKPGRPLAFGQLPHSTFFGLPGNPVSVMVTFALCVRPAIRKLSGETATAPLTLQATTLTKLRKRPGRAEYQRAVVSNADSGELVVQPFDYQGSGVLSTMSDANCFIVLDIDSSGVEAGQTVQVQPFSEVF